MRNKRILGLILSFFLCACSHNPATNSVDSNEEFEINLDVESYKLSNGLKLLVVENPTLPIFSIYTFYKIGGRHEGEGTTGASHFLEHMMFKGTHKYGPRIFDTYIERNGGSTNAYTSMDGTVYYQKLPSHTLEKIIEFEADRMVGLALEEKSFESERQVVLEERKLRYENSPRGKLYLSMMQEHFKGTPYGQSVIGSVKDLKSLDRNQVYEFFRNYYAPNNAVLVIAGDVKADEVYDLVKKYYGEIESSDKVDKIIEQKDNPKRYVNNNKLGNHLKVHGQSPNPMFMMTYKGVPLGEREAFVMDFVAAILGDGQSSYLNQRFVKNARPKLNSIGVSNYNLKFDGVFMISGDLLKNTSLSKFKRELERETTKMCDQAINTRSLQKAKNNFFVSYYHELKSNAGIAHFLGIREHLLDDYEFYQKEIETYQDISLEEVKKTCHRIFDSKERLFVSVWNKHPKS